MKKNILKYIFLCSLTIIVTKASSYKLNNVILKNLDQAGFFDRAIYDIINVRQKVKNLLHGKHLWHGISMALQTTANHSLDLIFKRADLLYGATFVVLSPTYPSLFKFVSSECRTEIEHYVQSVVSESMIHRLENHKMEGHFTGHYAFHPMTNKKLPIYVADYALSSFEVRMHNPHLAVPAHHQKDFEFAQKQHLEICLVATGQPNAPAYHQPVFIKDTKQLAHAFIRDADEIIITNSDFLNGSSKDAFENAVHFLIEKQKGKLYTPAMLYEFHGKNYSLDNLKTIETTLLREELHLSAQQLASQNEIFRILMHYAQADFLEIVGPFLNSIQTVKPLMVELIEESCNFRQTKNCYLLKWCQLKSLETEQIVFRRDILTFHEFIKFNVDLVNFLGDLASSCPHALDNLKKLKKVHE
ncbi:hypothetical protein HYV11_02445 [Candidatus Dependentiae bacterium]|nr:hypothetical protein [Candidatus Dependentiae bacterium]